MKLDRRVKWQQERKARGLCVSCGKRRIFSASRCRKCNEKRNIARRIKIGIDTEMTLA